MFKKLPVTYVMSFVNCYQTQSFFVNFTAYHSPPLFCWLLEKMHIFRINVLKNEFVIDGLPKNFYFKNQAVMMLPNWQKELNLVTTVRFELAFSISLGYNSCPPTWSLYPFRFSSFDLTSSSFHPLICVSVLLYSFFILKSFCCYSVFVF
jgi:hypothetical protein